MTSTHAKEEESQEYRISNKDFQRLKSELRFWRLNKLMNTQMMMMMKKMTNNIATTSTNNQSNFDRCFSDKLKRFTEIDQTSSEESSSTEEEYSPKSVLKRFVHHQVLKIREEDSHIGEDNIKEFTLIHVRALILPSSPLSGKNSIKSFPLK